MNDNAIATAGGSSRAALGGLAQRLVQDGLVEESPMQDAIHKSKEKRGFLAFSDLFRFTVQIGCYIEPPRLSPLT